MKLKNQVSIEKREFCDDFSGKQTNSPAALEEDMWNDLELLICVSIV